jgi:hypothetical protein
MTFWEHTDVLKLITDYQLPYVDVSPAGNSRRYKYNLDHPENWLFNTRPAGRMQPSECFCAAPKQMLNFVCIKFNSNK